MCFSVEDIYTAQLVDCTFQQPINQNTYLFTNENGFSLELEYAFPQCVNFNYELKDCNAVVVKSFNQPFLDNQNCGVVVKLFISSGDDCNYVSLLKKTTRNVGNYQDEQMVKDCVSPNSFTVSLGNDLCFKVTKQ